jgi:nitrous oxidase accessory protein NosD
LLPSPAQGRTLLADTVWEGEVLVEENILIPAGITLTVRKDTVVSVMPAESTRTDPEYMSSLTEITVRGTLIVEGVSDAPVVFRLNGAKQAKGSWAGIIVDGGAMRMRFCTVQDAETGIWVLGGTVHLEGTTLAANHYGLVAQQQDSGVTVTDSLITGNEYGLLTLSGAAHNLLNSRVTGNRKKDVYSLPAAAVDFSWKSYAAPPAAGQIREVGDEVLQGDVIWQGRLRVDGLVRVPSGSRLIILPGTVVEFRKKDSNGDGIGENGLMLQGVLLAKGTAAQPIFFRSAEQDGEKGDWDAVNIINSDGARNLIEYCQFEDAYRGLHFHFANVSVQHSVFRNNYRGVQFQESTVAASGNIFQGNTSAIQARDSKIVFRDNQVRGNVFGANFFRSHLTVQDNRFGSNLDFGLKIREGYPTVSGNVFDHNRFGLMFSDTSYGSVAGNLLLRNGESGMSVRKGVNLEINGNFVQANGLSGISLRESAAMIRDNHISENGERGVGVVSFQGAITGNTFSNSGLYAIAAEDEADVSAPLNWYDRDDIDRILFDRNDDPGRGRIEYAPFAEEPAPFAWPLATVPVDLRWSGVIRVPNPVVVPAGIALDINPGAGILFARNAGLTIRGRLVALGGKEQRIRFTAAEGREPESWGEILLEYAEGSRISNCDVEYATWGIHSHFTAMPVIGCTFRNNGGGLRFRSGPLLIKNSLFSDNNIGIRAYLGKAEITNCVITRNDKGIFVREQGGGLAIRENNIFDNAEYNIWVGDFNRENIQAAGNWWGKGDPAEKIFDDRREPGIGTVLYDPSLRQPLEISIVDSVQR